MGNLRNIATMWALLLLCRGHAHAQAFEVSAGSSTMYNAAGASVSIHGETSDWNFGGGIQQRRFAAGGSMQQRLHQGVLTLGMQQMHADLPTDIFDTAHRLIGVGAGFTRRATDDGTAASAFVGMSSVDGGSPLFRSGDVEHPEAYAQWSHPLFGRCRLVSLGIYVQHSVGLQSIECSGSGEDRWTLAATAGGGSSGGYGAGSLRYAGDRLQMRAAYYKANDGVDRQSPTDGPLPEPSGANASLEYKLSRSWSVSATHQNFLIPSFTDPGTPALSTSREATTLNQVGLGYSSHSEVLSFTALSSSLQGQASVPAGMPARSSDLSISGYFGKDFGPVRWTENLFADAPANLPRQTMLINGLELKINPHLLLSESVNVAKGTATLSQGGEIVTGNLAFRVSYELVYLANRPQDPYQQLTLVSAEMHLWHLLSLEASTDVDPMGKPLYTFRVATAAARLAPGGGSALSVNVGKSLLSGLVVDDSGRPVMGAALAIGSAFVYTDSHGFFSFRESRSSPHSLRVLTEEFLGPGHFEVESAPAIVVSARQPQDALPVRIVLRRTPPPETTATASVRPEPGVHTAP